MRAEARFPTRRTLRIAIVVLAVLTAVWMLTSAAVAYHLTRRTAPAFSEPVPDVPWAQFELHRIHTGDGEEIGAWLHRATNDAPTVLLLHGNGGSRRSCLPHARWLVEENFGVLMISLRAHGDSSGTLNDFGYSARHDVIAAIDFLHEQRPNTPTFVLGGSLGAAAAVFAAEELGDRVDAYVLDCLYSDLERAIANRCRIHLPPVLDCIAGTGLTLVAPLVLAHAEHISPREAMSRAPTDVPILLLAGSDDRHATPAEGQALHGTCKSRSEFHVFAGCGHLEQFHAPSEEYKRRVLAFLRGAR